MTIAQILAALEVAIKDCALLPIAVDVLTTVSKFAAQWNATTDPAQRLGITQNAVQRVYTDLTNAGLMLPAESEVLALVDNAFGLLAAAQAVHLAAPQPPPSPAPPAAPSSSDVDPPGMPDG